jgi:hypothetical protein
VLDRHASQLLVDNPTVHKAFRMDFLMLVVPLLEAIVVVQSLMDIARSKNDKKLCFMFLCLLHDALVIKN